MPVIKSFALYSLCSLATLAVANPLAEAEAAVALVETEVVHLSPEPNFEIEARAATCKQKGALRTIVAKYDDLTFTEPDATPIKKYKQLRYNNFYVDQFDGFIPAASGTQYAMSYDATKQRKISITQNGDTFDLVSFYVACNTGYPQEACNIQLYGYSADGRTKSGLGFKYPALDASKGFSMLKVDIYTPLWSNLSYIEFASARLEGGREVGLMVDDLTYNKRNCD